MLPNPLVTHLRGIKFSQVITASERRALIRKLICSNEDFALKFITFPSIPDEFKVYGPVFLL